MKRVVAFIGGLLVTSAAFAICPLCTFAASAGIGLSQYLGIDDTITGVWLGGFTLSWIILGIGWGTRAGITWWGFRWGMVVGGYLLTILPLHWSGLLCHCLNQWWGVDKLLLGIASGSGAFGLGVIGHYYLKRWHQGRVYFPFQKVVLPIIPMVLLSGYFYFLTR